MHDPIGAGRAAAALSHSTYRNNSAAAVAIAEPRWHGLDGVAGAERARFELARALRDAHVGLADIRIEIQYAGEMLILAEALDDPEALATALGALGTGYLSAGAHRGGVLLLESAAAIAREHDLPLPLVRALHNLAAFLNCRDLPIALGHAQQARDTARRAGLHTLAEATTSNMAISLWSLGRLTEVAELSTQGLEATDPQARIASAHLRGLARRRPRRSPPPARPGHRHRRREQPRLAGHRRPDRAVAADNQAEATRLAPLVLTHLLAASSLEDDFFLLWPPLVLAALRAGDLDLAERLLAPVTTALPGQRSPAVAAQWHRLHGLLAAARGEDPELAETEMRAGIDALAAFGAVGFHAQAQEELARWLANEHRDEEAAPLLTAARATYDRIGANGWLSRLDEWQTTHVQTLAASRTAGYPTTR